MRLKFLAMLVLLGTVACQADEWPPKVSDGPVGGSMEQRALMGGDSCSSDDDCLTRVCAEATCIGFLMISSDAARNVVGANVRDAFGKGDDDTRRLAAMARDMAVDELAEVFFRSRAVDFFRFLPCSHTVRLLPELLNSPDEPVRFYSSRALAQCGDAAGIKSLESFRAHESEAIRKLAGANQ